MPIDIGSIAAMSTSLKTAGEIVKVMIGLRDGVMLQSKISESQAVILSAQSDALSANISQFALLERVRELEKEIADMKAWDAEKEKYGLQQVGIGGFAYALKRQTGCAEPPHWICAACYEHRRKGILANVGHIKGNATILVFRCPQCKAEILVNWNLDIDYFSDVPGPRSG